MKTKINYQVYLLEIGFGCYAPYRCAYIGSTYAVSEKQAINNMSFRTGIPKFNMVGDYLEEGWLNKELRACPANEVKNKLKEWKDKYDQAV